MKDHKDPMAQNIEKNAKRGRLHLVDWKGFSFVALDAHTMIAGPSAFELAEVDTF